MILQHPELFDIPLAERVLEHVITSPRQHNQGYEMLRLGLPGVDECAQTGCIMGWAAAFNDNKQQYGRSGPDDLNITWDEYHNIYGECDNDMAIAMLRDYLAQAHVAQDVQDDYVLDDLCVDQLELVGV